jgi:hypothetical protein
MVLPAMAVGVLCLVKTGSVMGTYSAHNYDKNIKSAWHKENSLPGTDGIPIEVKERRKKVSKFPKYSQYGDNAFLIN